MLTRMTFLDLGAILASGRFWRLRAIALTEEL
jgi:hypothetical protein